MPEQQLTKRERQKANREAQRASQRAAVARARRNRRIAVVALVAVVAAGIGYVFVQRRAVAARLATATEVAGCLPDTEMPGLGAGHIEEALTSPGQNPDELYRQSPPESLYPDRPASSGRHSASVVASGVFDNRVDERLLVHDLEHGYILAYYGPSAVAGQVEALKDWGREALAGDFPKVIVAPWSAGPLPEGANFAFLSWNFRQLCDDFNPVVAQGFSGAHHGLNSRGPEAGKVGTHTPGTDGVRDPSTGDVLLPPLGDEPAFPDDAPAPGQSTDAPPA